MENNNSFIDNLIISVTMVSFIVGILNYEENLTQGDKQDLISELNNTANKLLDEIHQHLESQDNKLNKILERLEEVK